MRAVVQRAGPSSVSVNGAVVGAIDHGICVFLGVGPTDSEATARHLAARIAQLRIHPDEQGRMNLDLIASGGAALVISQFTLYADTSRGHRPSFIGAGSPELGERLCEVFVQSLRDHGLEVASGVFGAHMDITVLNDGPVTIVLSSDDPGWKTDAG